MGPYCLEECLQTMFTLETSLSPCKLSPEWHYLIFGTVPGGEGVKAVKEAAISLHDKV